MNTKYSLGFQNDLDQTTCEHEVDWSKWPQSMGICEKCGKGIQKPMLAEDYPTLAEAIATAEDWLVGTK